MRVMRGLDERGDLVALHIGGLRFDRALSAADVAAGMQQVSDAQADMPFTPEDCTPQPASEVQESMVEAAMVAAARAVMNGARGTDWAGRAPGYSRVSTDPADWREFDPTAAEPLPADPEPAPRTRRDRAVERIALALQARWHKAGDEAQARLYAAGGNIDISGLPAPDFEEMAGRLLDEAIIENAEDRVVERIVR